MFEKELFEHIQNNFNEYLPEAWQGVNVYFGEVPEVQKAPYIVMYPISNNGTRQVLCDNDDYTDGAISIQFNVYAPDYTNALYLGKKLDVFLTEIDVLDSFYIMLNNHENIRGFPDISNGLSLETITRHFTYTVIMPTEYQNLVCKLGVLAVLNNIRLAVN